MGFIYLDSIREVIEEGGGVGNYSFGNPPHTHTVNMIMQIREIVQKHSF